MKFLKRFGKNIRIYRELNKLSQEQLSEKMGISTGSLSRIECGRQFVKYQTLEKIAKAFDIPVGDLFHYTTHPNKMDSENKIELLQYIEAMNESEIEYFLNQAKIYGKLKIKLYETNHHLKACQ